MASTTTTRKIVRDLRGVLLDVGGVLAVPQPAYLARVLSAFGGITEDGALVKAHYQSMAAADGLHGFDWPTYHRHLLLACSVPAAAREDCARAMAHAVATVPDWWSYSLPGAAEALARLAQLVAVGVVSNSDGTVERVLRELQLAQVGPGQGANVAVIVDSAHVGVEKPDPAIFDTAVEALGLPREAIAYVGDTLAFDVAGSLAAGLYPIHVDPYDLCSDRQSHDHIRHLGDLVKILKPQRA